MCLSSAPKPALACICLQPSAPPGKAHPLVGQGAQTTGRPSVVFPTTHCRHSAVSRLVVWTHKGLVWKSTPPCWSWLGGVQAGEAGVGGCGVSGRKQPQAQDWWQEISIPWRAEAMMWGLLQGPGSPCWAPAISSSLLEGTSAVTPLHCQGHRDLPGSSSHWTSGKQPAALPPAPNLSPHAPLASYQPSPPTVHQSQALASHTPSESLRPLV